jgi:hypothetical protein
MNEDQVQVQNEQQVQQAGAQLAEPAPLEAEPKRRFAKLNFLRLSFPKSKLVLVLFASLLVLLVLIFVVIRLMGNGSREEVISTPTPEAVTEEGVTEENGELSQYASDPEIQKIGRELEELESKFNETTVREDALNIPLLDFEVGF